MPQQQQEPANQWCHAEAQKLRGQLERAQDALRVQELKLEQLGLLQGELGDAQTERQVSTTAKMKPSIKICPSIHSARSHHLGTRACSLLSGIKTGTFV